MSGADGMGSSLVKGELADQKGGLLEQLREISWYLFILANHLIFDMNHSRYL
jgi:hypothetical protein